jgi:hypothetical protein
MNNGTGTLLAEAPIQAEWVKSGTNQKPQINLHEGTLTFNSLKLNAAYLLKKIILCHVLFLFISFHNFEFKLNL